MTHAYLRGDPAWLEACHARAREATGVRLWNKFRGVGHAAALGLCAGAWHYFEWSVGSDNAHVADDVIRTGWNAFFVECSRSRR